MDVPKIFEWAGIDLGSKVADVGCHEGYLSVRLANRVGDNGKVYAVDGREERLERLNDNLKTRNVKNVELIFGDNDDPKLP